MSIVKSLSVGNGDMFYIKHGVDSFTIIDCCLSENDKRRIVDELISESANRTVKRSISTHPDDDHIRGLTYLHKRMPILNFYCVQNEATKEDHTDDFAQYCSLRDSDRAYFLRRGCQRKWLNETDEERGGAGIHLLWPITTNEHYKEALEKAALGECPNNISPIVKYSRSEGATVLWMGDLESDFMENIKHVITIDAADILFAPHHGRDSGTVPTKWLEQIDPSLIVIGEAPSEDLNYYEGYDTITQNSAGDITMECLEGRVHIFVSEPDYTVDFLDDENVSDTHGYYIGTLKTKAQPAKKAVAAAW